MEARQKRTLTQFLLASTILCGFAAPAIAQEGSIDFGIGIGMPYSGLGASGKYYVTNNSALQLSVGCVSLSNVISNGCGPGISYEFTGFIANDFNRNHALGVYVGLTGTENLVREESFSGYQRDVYGAGLYYSYYPNGFGNSGFHYGASSWVANETNRDGNKDAKLNISLHVGYRF